jgi:uncharacterized LabA/DUF88 family protein
MNEEILLLKKEKVYKPEDTNNINMPPGDLKRSPDESFFLNFHETLIFIDEAFLSKLSKHFGSGKYLKFDRIKFSKNLAEKEKLICRQIFLYISPPFQSPIPLKEEEIRKEGYDKFINNLKKEEIIIREGRCQRLKIDGKFTYNQKAVDVLLAMDLTSVPLKYPKIKRIILISSDSDFVPVIKNLKEQDVKTILYTYYERKRDSPFSRSNELIKSVFKYVLLNKKDLESCLFDKSKRDEKNG